MVGHVSVVGAGGFIGTALTRVLTGAGVTVHSFTRRCPAVRDGSLQPELLRSDAIFYTASSITPALAQREPRRVAEDHATLTQLLDSLDRMGRRPLLAMVSSGGTVYDPADPPPYDEGARLRPRSSYGRAKLAQENLLVDHADTVVPVILRLSNVYGPGQRTGGGYGVIGHWMEAVSDGREIVILGDPATRRDYVHIDDVGVALLQVYRAAARLRELPAPAIFNIGSGVPTSLGTLYEHFQEVLGRLLPVRYESARAFDHRDVWLDIGHVERVLGWRPAVELTDGIAETWERQYAPTPVGLVR